MKMVGQRGALQELQAWVDSAETRLEELLSQTRSSATELSRQLKECRVKKTKRLKQPQDCSRWPIHPSAGAAQDLQTEMISHQATLDFVDQPSDGCSTEDGHARRCEENRFAEEQGGLSRRWFRLQATLQCRVRNFNPYFV